MFRNHVFNMYIRDVYDKFQTFFVWTFKIVVNS